MSEFIHLHNHTHYSLLDAACTPSQLAKAAAADGQKACALTDHGVMFGSLEFFSKCKDNGIKPIIGYEAYVANGSRFDRTAGKAGTKKKNYFHLVLLAKNEVGYRNLIKLTSLGNLEGYYYKPRIDEELLECHHEGVIALSACIAGVVSSPLVSGDYQTALERAAWYKSLFGEDFYLELQNHGLDEDKIILRDVPKIARELGIKLVATNDVHYEKQEHAIAHNVLLYIKDISSQDAANIDIYKLRYRTPEMYFKTQKQMCELFRDFPEAIKSTLEIAEKIDFSFEEKLYMPEFPIPVTSSATNLDEYILELAEKGLRERFSEITPEIRSRFDYEMGVITKMGFSGYFLIVQDFINAARDLGVSVGPGRGSAAGSLVAYCLKITNVDPLRYDLLFERFLNPERISMPDIDIDFNDEKREIVIEYVKQKYGESSVAQIVTFGKLSSKLVLKDVGRVLGIPHTEINQITAKIPTIQGKVKPIKEALELPDLAWLKDTQDPKLRQLLEYSMLLEGFYRHTGTHAAGVVIAPGDITNYVPVIRTATTKKQGVDIQTQYSMADLERAGLLKMDFLGLQTLSILDHTLEMIERNTGEKIDIDAIPLDDEATFDLLSNGSTLAVFQFESKGMQEYLRQLKPRSIEEITAMNALYRPGPMDNIPEFIDRKHGKKPIEYLHPLMEKSLKNTYGIIVYQEQVMQLAQDIGGFTLGQADIMRKAMGKKNMAVMAKMKPQFINGASERGIKDKLANEIFDLIEKFASYGFNKSHSLAYSYVAYQTAYLKAHYPAEFLAANMTAELNDQAKIVQLVDEAESLDIKVFPPDVNRSYTQFSATGNTILFGMAAIKNVGVSAVDSIIEARKEKPFSSFFDFVARVDTKAVNKRSLEALVCAGAFDSMGDGHRAQYFAAIEPGIEYAKVFAQSSNSSMDSLFGSGSEHDLSEPPLPKIKPWADKERLEKEKEYLSFYVSGHPLNAVAAFLDVCSNLKLNEVESPLIGQQVRVCGLISSFRTQLDKRGNTIAFVQLEDAVGKAELVLWSKTYSQFKGYIDNDAIVVVTGKAESDGEKLKIIVEQIMSVDEAAGRFARGINIWIDLEKITREHIERMATRANDMNSRTKVIFSVKNRQANYAANYQAFAVNIPLNTRGVQALVDIFGKQNVKLIG